jgi:hypothetical protein
MIDFCKYRFKTEEEFIEEFGTNWRNIVRKNITDPLSVEYKWTNSMDYLFNKSLSEFKKILDFKIFFYIEINNGYFYKINYKCIKLLKIEPNYKPKKLVYD